MESGSAFDGVAFVGESGASFSDDVVEFVDRGDMFVDDGFADRRPQRFGWLTELLTLIMKRSSTVAGSALYLGGMGLKKPKHGRHRCR
jgi:hypothetical protein